jgi:hypothetical protein
MFRAVTAVWALVIALALAAGAHAQDSAYQVINVSGGGTISGIVKWSGPAPAVATMPVSKDPTICDPQSHKQMPLDRLIVGPQGGVANTVVFLRSISAGKAFSTSQPKPLLNQKYCRYEPHVSLVPQNSDLDIKSSDATLHTVHMEGAATYNLPFPFTNQISTRSMHTAGLVTLKCNGGHVWMNGEIWVIPHPYYAVTDESGKFELTGVPPGEYELVAWHEGWHILHQEGTFDVLTERRVERPIFSDPRTWDKKVSVSARGQTTVEFVISEK